MESDQIGQNQSAQNDSAFNQPTSSNVSFPTVGAPKKSGGPKTLLIIGILILVGILGFVIYKSANKEDMEVSEQPSPFDNVITNDSNNEVVATPTPTSAGTPKPADRSAVSIEVQNGTGITGEAAYLQNQLKSLGYTDVKVGNATSQDATETVVTFASSSSGVVSEITQKLNTIYQKVTVKTAATATTNVVIVTGLRKDATAKPSSTPTATPKVTTKPSASPSVSPSATP